jgi:ATP-dependent Clp protease ATP-binding subunit ClpB
MAFNMNKLTEKAQEALVAAQRLAEERRNTQLEPEHLLHALVSQEGGVVPAVLDKLGVAPRTLLPEIDTALAGLARASGPSQLYVSPRLRQVWETAQSEAERLKDEYISAEHFLLGLADDTGAAGQG